MECLAEVATKICLNSVCISCRIQSYGHLVHSTYGNYLKIFPYELHLYTVYTVHCITG